MNFDHIGIFCKNLKIGRTYFSKIFEIKKKSEEFSDSRLNVKVQFLYDKKNIKYELIAPLGKKNPVDQSLKKNKNIINHIAYKTKSFKKEISRLRKIGCIPLDKPKPAVAFNGKKVIFFLTPLRFIIELIEN